MMPHNFILLDNPIWNALQSAHKEFSIGTSEIKKYTSDILPFMGLNTPDENLLQDILPFMEAGEEIFIGGNLPTIPANWSIQARVNCLQMVCEKPSKIKRSGEAQIVKMVESDYEEMVALINQVLPGYFKSRTPQLGTYYGIKINGKLIAVSGERFKMEGFYELSAICTHPDFSGNGYAQQLMLKVSGEIFEQGMIPFLHVEESNKRAIRLYEYVGFKKRRDFSFLKLKSFVA